MSGRMGELGDSIKSSVGPFVKGERPLFSTAPFLVEMYLKYSDFFVF